MTYKTPSPAVFLHWKNNIVEKTSTGYSRNA